MLPTGPAVRSGTIKTVGWSSAAECVGSSPVLRIGLFGGVSVVTDDGRPVAVESAKCQTVLAALALSVGAAVPVSRLVELVWGQQPPRTAEKTLQWYVTRLRKTLGSEVLVRSGATYRLDLEVDAVDVARFRRRLDAGDIEGALAEWTGAPLAGLDAPGLTAIVDGLVEQWLGATEAHLERRVGTDAQAAIGPLTELTASHPFREGFWALLMTALYRVGRQADALAAFHRAREQLVEHLGVEPGPRLRELESAILRQDAVLHGPDGPSTDSRAGRPTGTVTFGFAEVVGATRLWATHRQSMASVMARVDEVVRAVADRHGGIVFAASGPLYGAAFHRAGEAAAWATALQAATRSEPWPGGGELLVRIGLHTGETEERGEGYFGPAVNAAARIATAGHGGQILMSGVTAGVLDRTDLHDLGWFRLDDVVAEQQILQLGDGQHPPLRTADARRGNLPVRLGRLIGRDEDLEILRDALGSGRVVTLVGPGGIGKTRLALAAARMSDVDGASGAWLVELAEIASSGDVPRAVADALGVTERPGRTLLQSIVAFLRSRAALLVLDNCEHVIDGAAGLARAIAEGCTDVRVLATSRASLGVPDERLIAVAPLEPAGPGAELFIERALAVSQTFDPNAVRDDVEEICRRLDGVPLAIELAAARMRSLAPADLLARLDDQLRLLTSRRRTSIGRHRTLRATIQWSYDLLTPPEQVLLKRLSVFAGTFDLAAAERVTADAEVDVVDVDDLLDNLVDRSMLIVEPGPFGRRFRLLETMRQFAAEHLSERGHTDPIAERHAQWCLDQVTRIHKLLTGPAEIEGVARLRELWPNLRAAVDWACASRDRKFAHALVRPIAAEVALRGRHEIGDWAERILAITPPDDEGLTVFWLTWAAERYAQSGDQEAYQRLVRHYGEPDHPLIRYTRAYLHGQGDELRACLPEVVAGLRRQGDDYLAGLMELNTAGTLLGIGRFEEVDAFVSALADRYRAQGPPTLLNWTLATLGYSAMFQGKLAQADRYFAESASVDVPDRTLSANKTIEARAAFRRGQRTRAFRILRSYIDELLETDNVIAASVVGIEFINMMAAIDRLPDAARMLGYLETTNDFGALASRTLVSDAANKIAADTAPTPDPEQAPAQRLDDRQALAYMRDILAELA
jgi:predicted ATPase/DNA-binding SARP family transcriptional activator